MTVIETFGEHSWTPAWSGADRERAIGALEHGRVLFFPALAFRVTPDEGALFRRAWAPGRSKNLSFDPERSRLRHSGLDADTARALSTLMGRYARLARGLVASLLPRYERDLQFGLTSFRPVEIAGRSSSERKDDRRLHPDAFPSRPTRGRRILRTFSNVDPDGRPRVWEVGQPFEAFAAAFLPRAGRPIPGSRLALAAVGLTRGCRTRYDHLMLRLHDLAKADDAWQRSSPRETLAFPAGSTWIVFTDQVLHAAVSGCHALEQTFHLPVAAQRFPETAPLRVLERLTGRACA